MSAVAGEPPGAPAPPRLAVVRQPIADERHDVVGYALRFAAAPAAGDGAPDARATSARVAETFGEVGLERLAGRRPAWVQLARNFLVEVGAPPVRPDRAVLEVVAYPARPDLLELLGRLTRAGYSLALTEFAGPEGLGALLDLCTLVCVDVGEADPAALAARTAAPRAAGAVLVARGVETAEAFARCRAAGFSLFQGSYLSRPSAVRLGDAPAVGAGSLATLARVSGGDVTFEELERIVTADVGLSLKLLRHVNSAFFGLPRTLGSVREALGILGARTVRRWALVVALADQRDAPEGVVTLALQRARTCERLGAASSPQDRETLFTIGLFSAADALMDAPLAELVEALPLSLEVEAALLRHAGPKGEILAAVLEYERGGFPDFAVPGLPGGIAAAYEDGVDYADGATGARDAGAPAEPEAPA